MVLHATFARQDTMAMALPAILAVSAVLLHQEVVQCALARLGLLEQLAAIAVTRIPHFWYLLRAADAKKVTTAMV